MGVSGTQCALPHSLHPINREISTFFEINLVVNLSYHSTLSILKIFDLACSCGVKLKFHEQRIVLPISISFLSRRESPTDFFFFFLLLALSAKIAEKSSKFNQIFILSTSQMTRLLVPLFDLMTQAKTSQSETKAKYDVVGEYFSEKFFESIFSLILKRISLSIFALNESF